jgi:hypothetical protein
MSAIALRHNQHLTPQERIPARSRKSFMREFYFMKEKLQKNLKTILTFFRGVLKFFA